MGRPLPDWMDVRWVAEGGAYRLVYRWRQQRLDAQERPATAQREGRELVREATLLRRVQAERGEAPVDAAESSLRLRAWRLCEGFVVAAHRAVGQMRGERPCGIAGRLLDVARMAHLCVAEGCGRRARHDCLFFLRRAEALLEEAVHLLDAAGRYGWLRSDSVEELLALHLDAIRALDALLARLEREPAPSRGGHALA